MINYSLVCDNDHKFDAWVRAHRPGSKASRAAQREIERQNREARDLVSSAQELSPEAQALQRAIDDLRASVNPLTGGVFE